MKNTFQRISLRLAMLQIYVSKPFAYVNLQNLLAPATDCYSCKLAEFSLLSKKYQQNKNALHADKKITAGNIFTLWQKLCISLTPSQLPLNFGNIVTVSLRSSSLFKIKLINKL